ncbi:hypothetical protein MaudCBS49596_004229 [Microsporum audouinii]
MFELPSAKRVCRDELKSPESSRASSPESTAATYAATALERAFSSFETFNTKPTAASAGQEHQTKNTKENEEDEEQEFEFRLFSSAPAREDRSTKGIDELQTTAKGHNGSNFSGVQKLKIRLRSPSPSARPAGDGGFTVPFRGWDYYFSNPAMVMRAVGDGSWQSGSRDRDTSKRLEMIKETFRDAAVDGDTVLARAASASWPGCHLPWRVVHIPAPKVKSASSTVSASKPEASLSGKKKKPGKKRRIALRKRVVSKKAAEEAEREKRNRKNRERKVKRRQKERDKKAAARAAAGEGEGVADVAATKDKS